MRCGELEHALDERTKENDQLEIILSKCVCKGIGKRGDENDGILANLSTKEQDIEENIRTAMTNVLASPVHLDEEKVSNSSETQEITSAPEMCAQSSKVAFEPRGSMNSIQNNKSISAPMGVEISTVSSIDAAAPSSSSLTATSAVTSKSDTTFSERGIDDPKFPIGSRITFLWTTMQQLPIPW